MCDPRADNAKVLAVKLQCGIPHQKLLHLRPEPEHAPAVQAVAQMLDLAGVDDGRAVGEAPSVAVAVHAVDVVLELRPLRPAGALGQERGLAGDEAGALPGLEAVGQLALLRGELVPVTCPRAEADLQVGIRRVRPDGSVVRPGRARLPACYRTCRRDAPAEAQAAVGVPCLEETPNLLHNGSPPRGRESVRVQIDLHFPAVDVFVEAVGEVARS
mmetsp:Transcript_125182/g.348339  ORF Transcript_125182/g.348339 Transcript_125182/m.348339 type:complete len:215 (+) Transcript_125182:338-982(+)